MAASPGPALLQPTPRLMPSEVRVAPKEERREGQSPSHRFVFSKFPINQITPSSLNKGRDRAGVTEIEPHLKEPSYVGNKSTPKVQL